jgi:hypothetical protein
VFLAMAHANLIHKFVLKVQVSGRGLTSKVKAATASRSVGVDANGDPVIQPEEMGALIERWVEEYRARDEAAAEAAMSPEARAQLQAERAAAASVGETVEVSERSAGSRGPPISEASLLTPPSSHVSVSTSLTHLSVSNGRIRAVDLAADYRRVLEFSERSDQAEQADGDMVDALRLSMQDLVASRRRSAAATKRVVRERRARMAAKEAALREARGEEEKDTEGQEEREDEVESENAHEEQHQQSADTRSAATSSGPAAAGAAASGAGARSATPPSSPLPSAEQRTATAKQEQRYWKLLRTAMQRATTTARAAQSASPATAPRPTTTKQRSTERP